MPALEPFPGAAFFRTGRRSPIITAMGRRLVAEKCGKYTTGPGPEWTDIDRRSYAAWQSKIGFSASDADGIPGLQSWNRLKVPATRGAGSRVFSPVPGHNVTTAYHKEGRHWSLGYHTGADYAAPQGTPCVAVLSGTVRAGKDKSFGDYLVLSSGGFDYWYCHLSHWDITSGPVRAGQQLAEVGTTGNSTGPHLHFEKRPAHGRFGSDLAPLW
ncbi:peptidoglycan-binding protein [Streptomyces sp. NPDC059378]|uniref:peptidoglycan-binding protein n=1 Tax=Streptomyces sp. NPDC059378 TaxID=3346815 RepID=UPI003673920C